MVLKARNLAVSDEQRERVEACAELGTLKRWAENALTAASTDGIFK